MTHPGCALAQPQDRGRFAVAESLEVSENQHLAIQRLQTSERDSDSVSQLFAEQVAARTRTARDQPLGQLHHRLVRQRRRLLARHTPPLCSDVPLVLLGDSLPGKLAQPRIEWQRSVAQVFREALMGVG